MIEFIRQRKLVMGVATAALLSAVLLIWVGSRSSGDDSRESDVSVTTIVDDIDSSDSEDSGADPTATNPDDSSDSDTQAIWPTDASQSESDVQRDGVNPVLGQLTFAQRVDPQGTVNAGGKQWVLSQLPIESRNQIVDDGLAGRDLDPFGGEVLIVEDDVIVRAFPFNEFPPSFLATDGTLVYAARIGDGGYPDSALLAINALTLRADRIVMRTSGPDAPAFYPEIWEEGSASQRIFFDGGDYLRTLQAASGTLESDDDWVVRSNPERGLCAAVADIDYGCDDESQFISETDPDHTPRIVALPVPPEGIDTDQIGVLIFGFLPEGAVTVEIQDQDGDALGFEPFVDEELQIWVLPAAVANEPFSIAYLSEDDTVVLQWPNG